MPFWLCYYHLVWATKNREPLITEPLESVLYDAVQSKSQSLGCPVLAVNSVCDHVHVAVSIVPTLPVADWVKLIKGVSSHAVNETLPSKEQRFRWQKSYAVLTVGQRHLPMVVEYVQRQKEHHATGNVYTSLEYTGE